MAGDFSHLGGDIFIERNVMQNSRRISGRGTQIVQRAGRNASFLDEVDHFCDCDGRNADMVAGGDRLVNKSGSSQP